MLTPGIRAMLGLVLVALIAASISSLFRSDLIGLVVSIAWFGPGESLAITLMGREFIEPGNRVLPGQIVTGMSSIRDPVTFQEYALLAIWAIVLFGCGLLVFMKSDIQTG